jgi:metallo-beta-lactamase class B
MTSFNRGSTLRLSMLTFALALAATPARAQTVMPDTVEAHLAAGKRAVGGRDGTPDFYGLVTALCVAPQRGAPRPDAPAPREDPDRKIGYLEPKKAFDDVYWLGTRGESAWLLTSDDGYILYDTARVWDAEEILVGGMHKLGLDPARVKYVIVSHGHLGESGGAYLFQSRYGARIVTADLGPDRGQSVRLSHGKAEARYRRHRRHENHRRQPHGDALSDAGPHIRHGLGRVRGP